MFLSLLAESGIVLAYAGVGSILMLIGYFVVDLVTPGKLHELLWQERSKNAAILVGSSLLAVAIVVATAIRASADDFVLGLLTTFVFGLLGIVLQALSFLAINLLSPGSHAQMVHEENIHPAAAVSASAYIGISLIMASAIL